jgi:hypothetical protein
VQGHLVGFELVHDRLIGRAVAAVTSCGISGPTPESAVTAPLPGGMKIMAVTVNLDMLLDKAYENLPLTEILDAPATRRS